MCVPRRYGHVTRHRNILINNGDKEMLHYAVVFLIIAIIAGVLGFGFISGVAAVFAKWCFIGFLVLAVIAMLTKRRVA